MFEGVVEGGILIESAGWEDGEDTGGAEEQVVSLRKEKGKE